MASHTFAPEESLPPPKSAVAAKSAVIFSKDGRKRSLNIDMAKALYTESAPASSSSRNGNHFNPQHHHHHQASSPLTSPHLQDDWSAASTDAVEGGAGATDQHQRPYPQHHQKTQPQSAGISSTPTSTSAPAGGASTLNSKKKKKKRSKTKRSLDRIEEMDSTSCNHVHGEDGDHHHHTHHHIDGQSHWADYDHHESHSHLGNSHQFEDDEDEQYYSDDDTYDPQEMVADGQGNMVTPGDEQHRQPHQSNASKKKKKKRKKSGPVSMSRAITTTASQQRQTNMSLPHHHNSNNHEDHNSAMTTSSSHHGNHGHGHLDQHHAQNDGFWHYSDAEERQRIREFWFQLKEEERRSLVRVEKEAVLKKMKEQQRHSCSCSLCGRKRTAIEEELELLYDAYYDELEQYANQQQPSAGAIQYVSHDGHEYDDDDQSDEYDDEDDEDYDDEDDDESYEAEQKPNPYLSFTNSLQAKGNILTVAEDLLENDGKKFLEMMERLADRKVQRDDELMDSRGAYEEYDDEEGDFEDDEVEEDALTKEQRMEEGRRMFQAFAARMFEQRVLSAYREKVAEDRQARLLAELDEESRLEQLREERKEREKEKKRDKKRLQRQQKEEERAQKQAQKLAEEKKILEEKERKLEADRKRREEERRIKDEEKRLRDEDRARKEEERRRKLKEEKALEQERERKLKEEAEAREMAELARRQEEHLLQEKKQKERQAQLEQQLQEEQQRQQKLREEEERVKAAAAEAVAAETQAIAEKEAMEQATATKLQQEKEQEMQKQEAQHQQHHVAAIGKESELAGVVHQDEPLPTRHASRSLSLAEPSNSPSALHAHWPGNFSNQIQSQPNSHSQPHLPAHSMFGPPGQMMPGNLSNKQQHPLGSSSVGSDLLHGSTPLHSSNFSTMHHHHQPLNGLLAPGGPSGGFGQIQMSTKSSPDMLLNSGTSLGLGGSGSGSTGHSFPSPIGTIGPPSHSFSPMSPIGSTRRTSMASHGAVGTTDTRAVQRPAPIGRPTGGSVGTIGNSSLGSIGSKSFDSIAMGVSSLHLGDSDMGSRSPPSLSMDLHGRDQLHLNGLNNSELHNAFSAPAPAATAAAAVAARSRGDHSNRFPSSSVTPVSPPTVQHPSSPPARSHLERSFFSNSFFGSGAQGNDSFGSIPEFGHYGVPLQGISSLPSPQYLAMMQMQQQQQQQQQQQHSSPPSHANSTVQQQQQQHVMFMQQQQQQQQQHYQHPAAMHLSLQDLHQHHHMQTTLGLGSPPLPSPIGPNGTGWPRNAGLGNAIRPPSQFQQQQHQQQQLSAMGMNMSSKSFLMNGPPSPAMPIGNGGNGIGAVGSGRKTGGSISHGSALDSGELLLSPLSPPDGTSPTAMNFGTRLVAPHSLGGFPQQQQPQSSVLPIGINGRSHQMNGGYMTNGGGTRSNGSGSASTLGAVGEIGSRDLGNPWH